MPDMGRLDFSTDRIIKQINSGLNGYVWQINAEIIKTLAGPPPVGTPIDTQFASSNWHISIKEPSDKIYGSKENISRGGQRASIARAYFFDYTKHKHIYINNNVPYIAMLNYGRTDPKSGEKGEHSHQSPLYFVETAIKKILVIYQGRALGFFAKKIGPNISQKAPL
jgi:hypothetical protein